MTLLVRPLVSRPHASLRLFCFPYAGGGISVFRGWSAGLPGEVEPWAIQLPGREDRIGTPPFQSMSDVLNALVPAIIPQLDRPFAFFGHSMGSVVALELTRTLQRLEAGSPDHLFVSGRLPPHAVEVVNSPLHQRSDAELTEVLRSWQATPEAVLADRELMRLLLPVIRADLSVIETHTFTDGPLLDCPITAFGGTEDNADPSVLARWGELTSSQSDLRMFPGGHFFLNSARETVVAAVSAGLHQALVSRID
ncbi:thioesterase II family protein [Streptomyces sp. NPDC102283]|uniref:thioesterase II family protein n=1 Tax=Streptomyces sp. NPDC102283 TaxID=3366155 RepID=UPI00382CE12D